MTKEAHLLEARCRIGGALRHFREKAKLTQVEVADKIGVTSRTVMKIESGRYSVTLDTINAYASAVGKMIKIV